MEANGHLTALPTLKEYAEYDFINEPPLALIPVEVNDELFLRIFENRHNTYINLKGERYERPEQATLVLRLKANDRVLQLIE